MLGGGFVWVWQWADLRVVVRWTAESFGMRKEEISLIVEHQKGVNFGITRPFARIPSHQASEGSTGLRY